MDSKEHVTGDSGIVGRPRPKESLRDIIARKRKEKQGVQELAIEDNYSKAYTCKDLIKLPTGITFDDRMELHKCTWDPNHPETPHRYRVVWNRCDSLGLIKRSLYLSYDKINIQTIATVHKKQMIINLKNVSDSSNEAAKMDVAKTYDSVYFNEHTFETACLAVACTVTLAEKICLGTVKNGMAIVRPPGHHAMANEYNGFCFFNNVAIATKHILKNKLAERILIVDIDVHHGQGIQQIFYNDKRVLYFSIHRYEHGTFWPNLQQSNFDHIGEGPGLGYNINVPLNEVGLGDSDYIAVIQQILLPVAYEFNPQLILISAGYDASIGCAEGMMNVTPGLYAHLVILLSGLASGRIGVVLEGGYFYPSLAEGAAMTLKALLGDQPPRLEATSLPNDTVLKVISNVKFYLKDYWKCFQAFSVRTLTAIEPYVGEPETPPFLLAGTHPKLSAEEVYNCTERMRLIASKNDKLGSDQPVAYSYDADMLLHESTKNTRHTERPERLEAIYNLFQEWGLDKRCLFVEPRVITYEIANLVHSSTYLKLLFGKGDLVNVEDDTGDVYYNKHSPISIRKSAGTLLSIVDSVMNNGALSGVALIRPPGHHAEQSHASGFCHLNNISIAAKYILEKWPVKKILIVDFDIHHGNGTQKTFYDTHEVLYISIHRYDNGSFYPKTKDGAATMVGNEKGVGYNVNIPLNFTVCGNTEYFAIFHKIILPIAYAYAPDVVLISAGFDAGIGDPLGHYNVTPEAFGQFVKFLSVLAAGKLILALEGGYNIETLKYSMNICIKTLLGDPLPIPYPITVLSKQFIRDIRKVIKIQKEFWPILNTNYGFSEIEENRTSSSGDEEGAK